MSNTRHGVMKIPTAPFGTAQPITARCRRGTGGVPFEPIASMTGVEQMDLLDAQRTIVIARGAGRRAEPDGHRAALVSGCGNGAMGE